MSESPFVSIIIPCREIEGYAKECVKHCNQLDYGSYEIILLPDDAVEKVDGVKVMRARRIWERDSEV